MLKLYLKKLLSGLIYIIISIAVYFAGSAYIITISRFFENDLIRLLIMSGIPAFISFLIIYIRRRDRSRSRIEYFKNVTHDEFVFKEELKYIIRSKDFTVELYACATVAALLSTILMFAAKSKDASAIVGILVGLFFIIIIMAVYALCDLSVWLLVHKQWIKFKCSRCQETSNYNN